MGVKCFWLEDAGKIKRYLRRYHEDPCSAPWTPFGGMAYLDEVPHPPREMTTLSDKPDGLVARDDPRWPRVCECGREFVDSDHRQIFVDTVYRRVDTGEEMSLRGAPPGAMWDAWWYGSFKGDDGRSIVVVCPGGHEWLIDGRAKNCTMLEDWEHRCWIRHGVPPNLTVDKNGKTCAAGAGSIQTQNWHGFLRNGELVT
jgi:hypothetical protein